MSKKAIPFILLDDSITTYGFRVQPSGVNIDQFKKNPVMFYDHNDWHLPIGHWENIRLEGNQLLADAVFDYKDANEEVQRIIGKVERGIIKMASVGLTDIVASDDSYLLLEGQTLPTIVQCRLREASIVTIGANHNAVRLYDKDDTAIDFSQGVHLGDFIKTKYMNKKVLEILNLSDKATDEEVSQAVIALSDKTKELEEKLSAIELADKKKQREAFLSDVKQAIKESKITAQQENDMITLYDANPDAASKFLKGLPKRPSVAGKIEESTKSQVGNEMKFNDKSWDDLDRANLLLELKEKHPEIYVEKFKEKFGKEPGVTN